MEEMPEAAEKMRPKLPEVEVVSNRMSWREFAGKPPTRSAPKVSERMVLLAPRKLKGPFFMMEARSNMISVVLLKVCAVSQSAVPPQLLPEFAVPAPPVHV